jgi:ribonuclease HI
MNIILNTDGGARGNPGPAGIGAVIYDESGKILGEYKKYIGEATNNVAEYKALIMALEQCCKNLNLKPEILNLTVRMDSELIVRQMIGQYKIKEPTLKLLAGDVIKLTKNFKNVNFTHVRREQNKLADKLVNEAIDEAI